MVTLPAIEVLPDASVAVCGSERAHSTIANFIELESGRRFAIFEMAEDMFGTQSGCAKYALGKGDGSRMMER
jgi:hypothetical protein